MPIPDFQTLMHPLLRLMSDRREKSVRETSDLLVEELRVTPEELAILLPSGQSVFRNRVGWAKTYLSKAGLLASTRRGYFSITDRGIEVLAQAPNRIDIRFLEQFPEFVGFRERAIQTEPEDAAAISKQDSEQTPDEALDQAYARIQRELADQVLTAVKPGSSRFFEDMVVKLLLAMGYGGSRLDAGKSLGRPGDEGIDGLINEDKLGLDSIYVQAKKWEGTVGRPEIQKFVGALHGKRAKKGGGSSQQATSQMRPASTFPTSTPRLRSLTARHWQVL